MWQIGEKFARLVGHHSLKFGADYHRSIGTRNNPQIPDFLYSSLSAMLANQPSSVTATLGSGLYSGRMYEFGVFAQDDWRVASNLTVNLGMRYDFYSNFVATGEGGTPDAGLYNPSSLSMDGSFAVGLSGPARARSITMRRISVRASASLTIPMEKAKPLFAAASAPCSAMWCPRTSGISYRAPKTSRTGLPSLRRISAAFGIKFPDFNENLFKYAQQLVKNQFRGLCLRSL